MSQPLVSIIMPTYNHGQFIAEAIQSVIDQTYQNWEVVIVNNYSTDNTDEVVASFSDPRIHMVKFANEGVIARSRNHGISLSSGEYVSLLDSDDRWLPAKLQRQIEVMKRKKDINLCSTALRIIPSGVRAPFFYTGNRRIGFKELIRRNSIFNSSVTLRRSVIALFGEFDEDPSLRTVEDYEYWLRLLSVCDRSAYFLDSPLTEYRISSMNISGMGRALEFDVEMTKFERIASKLVSGETREHFLRVKKGEVARRCFEYSSDRSEKKVLLERIPIQQRIRMRVARIVKRISA
jgi:glycosyltransferase involved in cell wall biosynthesis